MKSVENCKEISFLNAAVGGIVEIDQNAMIVVAVYFDSECNGWFGDLLIEADDRYDWPSRSKDFVMCRRVLSIEKGIEIEAIDLPHSFGLRRSIVAQRSKESSVEESGFAGDGDG